MNTLSQSGLKEKCLFCYKYDVGLGHVIGAASSGWECFLICWVLFVMKGCWIVWNAFIAHILKWSCGFYPFVCWTNFPFPEWVLIVLLCNLFYMLLDLVLNTFASVAIMILVPGVLVSVWSGCQDAHDLNNELGSCSFLASSRSLKTWSSFDVCRNSPVKPSGPGLLVTSFSFRDLGWLFWLIIQAFACYNSTQTLCFFSFTFMSFWNCVHFIKLSNLLA